MRGNPVKEALASGGRAFGTYAMEFYTTGLCRIVANAGAEFIIFDMEHGGWGIESLKQQVALAHAAGLVPIVNTPGGSYERTGLLLDIGAMGLMVPHVESGAQAAEIVRQTRYAPDGVRGGGFGVAHDDYDAGDVATTIRVANRRTLIIAKIESRKGVAAAADILAVDGIDVALVTSGDLTLDLGVPGQGSARRDGARPRGLPRGRQDPGLRRLRPRDRPRAPAPGLSLRAVFLGHRPARRRAQGRPRPAAGMTVAGIVVARLQAPLPHLMS